MIENHYRRARPVTPDSTDRFRMTATLRAALLSCLLGAAALGTGGCVYRPNIQQGNLLHTKDIDQVQVGMTRSQVRYLLGTPMISDPFNPQRWDYIYTFQRGREPKVERAHFVVRFDGDKVSSVERLDQPDDVSAARRGEVVTPDATREPPPPPSIQQPQPDAPRPGGNSPN
jgi:outer membrane protein assembly factor BamE